MKYLRAVFIGILMWCLAFVILGAVSFVINSLLYPAFLQWFPRLVPEYNFVNEREDYERFYLALSVIAVAVSIFILSYASVRLDNERMEYMITKTEGKYTLGEGVSIYFTRYFYPDVLAAAVIPLPLLLIDIFALPFLGFLPEGLLSLINMPFEPTRIVCEAFGIVFGYLFMAVLFFLSRLLAGLRALDIWRVLWLSDIQYVG